MKELDTLEKCLTILAAGVEETRGVPEDEELEFTCPVCWGPAFAVRERATGRHHVLCPFCKVNITQ